MLFLIVVLNLVISVWNAFSVGSIWDAARGRGGLAYFMAWMGAIMAAVGFSWTYLAAAGMAAAWVPISRTVDGVTHTAPLFGPSDLHALFSLGYLVLIFPLLGSGLALTLESWRAVVRRGNPGDFAVAGWNTFAQVENMRDALREVPDALETVGALFFSSKGSKRSSSKDDDSGDATGLIFAFVVLALAGGVATTYAIVQARRRVVIHSLWADRHYGA
jgi:hypothetical protein